MPSKKLANLPGYTKEEVRKHNTEEDCWMVIRKKVYKFPTEFINEMHPGGPVLMDCAGVDGTIMFEDGPHNDNSREILEEYLIGKVVTQEEIDAAAAEKTKSAEEDAVKKDREDEKVDSGAAASADEKKEESVPAEGEEPATEEKQAESAPTKGQQEGGEQKKEGEGGCVIS